MANKVAFFETQSQLDVLLNCQQNSAEVLPLALSAEADFVAERIGIRYATIEDFYSVKELVQAVERQCSRLEWFFERIDEAVRKRLPKACAEAGFSTWSYGYFLHILIVAVLRSGGVFSEVVHKFGQVDYSWFRPRNFPVVDELWFEPQTLAPRVLRLLAHAKGLVFEELEDAGPPPVQDYTSASLPTGARTGASCMVDEGAEDIAAILVCNLYGNRKILDEFSAQGGRHVQLDSLIEEPGPVAVDDGLRKGCLAAWDELKRDEEFRRFCSLCGTCYFDVLEDRLRHFVCNVVSVHLAWAPVLRNLLVRKKYFAVLSNSLVRTRDIVCCVAARLQKIPVVMVQHGPFYHNPRLQYTDVRPSDHILCYGDGEREYLVNKHVTDSYYSSHPVPRIVVTGSPDYDLLFRKMRGCKGNPGKELLVLYAVSNLGSCDIPEITYSRIAKKVLSLCARYDDAKILFKPFPSAIISPIESWIRRQRFSNIQVIDRWTPFSDLLSMADVVVLDETQSPALQAAATDKEIIVLFHLDNWSYFPETLFEEMEKRMVLCRSIPEFLDAIERRLKQGKKSSPGNVDWSLFQNHAMSKNDGRSAERITNIMLKLSRRTMPAPSHS
jgi:hypothetical protein